MKIAVFEEHGEVLAHWVASGWKSETLVIFDRHFDFKRIAEEGRQKIVAAGSNAEALVKLNRDVAFRSDARFAYGLDDFLFAARELGLVRRIVWVYPSPRPLADVELVRLLWKQFERIPGFGRELLTSFSSDAAGARVELGGLAVEVTTLERLPLVALPAGFRLDVDLDYFFMKGPELTHSVEDVAAALAKLPFEGASVAFTYSISSGFLPASYRWVGEKLAQALGGNLVALGGRPQKSARIMEALSGAPAGRQRLTAAELDALVLEAGLEGGAEWSARSVLALANLGVDEAMRCYHEAVRLGDQAIWPAYSIGLHFFERKQYAEALEWFARASTAGSAPSDSLEVHSAFLRAFCAFRLADHELALELASRLAELTPLREDLYPIALAAAQKLERKDEAERLAARQREVQALRTRLKL